MVAAEAVACGTPVVALSAGGVLEIVEDGKPASFAEQTPEALVEAVGRAVGKRWNRQAIAMTAAKFSLDNFKQGITPPSALY